MKKLWKITLRVGLVLFLIGLGLLGYVFLIEPDMLVVNEYEIHLKKWDRELDGLRIVMISDIHAGSNFIDQKKIQTVVERANEQNADLIVLLGDFISHTHSDKGQLKMQPGEMADCLQGLKARYGVYAVMGNHEYWFGYEAVQKELERVGYQVLDGRSALITTDKGTFGLTGLTDVLTFGNRRKYSDYAKSAIQAVNDGKHKIIALTHNPDVAMMITDNREGQYKISDHLVLLLAGHTHGGQVDFPLIGTPLVMPSSFGYTRGHLVESGLDMFITSGVGTSSLPVRFRMPPEIAVITIRSDPN